MKVEIREESFKISKPSLILFSNANKIRSITVKKEVKSNRFFVR